MFMSSVTNIYSLSALFQSSKASGFFELLAKLLLSVCAALFLLGNAWALGQNTSGIAKFYDMALVVSDSSHKLGGNATKIMPPISHRAQSVLQTFELDEHVLGFARNHFYLAGRNHLLRVEFLGASPVLPLVLNPQVDDASNTQNRAPSFTGIGYWGLWDGVDLSYRKGSTGLVESLYEIHPGGDPSHIHLGYNRPVRLRSDGGLVIDFDTGTLHESAPIAWQEINGRHQAVDIAFTLLSKHQVGFRVGDYDPRHPLWIDPELSWNAVLGSPRNSLDQGRSIVSDSTGNLYIVGTTGSEWGEAVRAYSDNGDAFVAKLSGRDGDLIWHTFLGGSASDHGYAIDLDANGNLLVTGDSGGSWGAPKRPHSGGDDAFIAKLSGNDGSLLWNTFLGGSYTDYGRGIVASSSGEILVTGYSNKSWGAPIRVFTGKEDAFVSKLSGSDGSLIWNTFLGGDELERGYGVTLNQNNDVLITGESNSNWGNPTHPYTEGQGSRGYDWAFDVFIVKLSSHDGSMIWNTFLGSTDHDGGFSVVSDFGGSLFIAGYSSGAWGSPRHHWSGFNDAFIAKLSGSDGDLVWNTFLGGTDYDEGYSISLDSSEGVLVSGFSAATWGVPVRAHSGGWDALVAKLAKNDGSLVWHTFIGGASADYAGDTTLDDSGNVLVVGYNREVWGNPVGWNGVGQPSVLVARLVYHTVTPSAGQNGSISPASPQTLDAGNSASFVVSPTSGYRAQLGGTCGGTLLGNVATTLPVTSDCTLNVTFVAERPGYTICAGDNLVIQDQVYAAGTSTRCVGASSATFVSSEAKSGSAIDIFAPEINVLPPAIMRSGSHARLVPVVSQQTPVQVVNEGSPQSIVLPTGSGSYTLGTPAHGTLSGGPLSLVYTPQEGYIGPDSFAYMFDDGVNPPKVALINLDVQAYSHTPDMVQLVDVSSTAPDQLTVNWLPTQDDATPHSNLRYQVHLSTQESFYPNQSNVRAEVIGGITATISDLQPSTRYFVMVSALDADLNRAWSNPMSATTIAATPTRTGQRVFVQTASNSPVASENSVTYINTGSLPQVGDIITSRESGGYLRRVEAVSQSGSNVTATTSLATMSEVFADLDLETNITLAPLPESSSQLRETSLRSASGEKIDAREMDWGKGGLTMLDTNAYTLRRRSVTRDLSAQAANRAQIDVDGAFQYIKGEYLRVRAPAYVATEPDRVRGFDVSVLEVWDRQNGYGSYTHMQLCKIKLHDFTHPDSGIAAGAETPAVLDKIYGSGNAGYSGDANVTWQAGKNDVDGKGRPFQLTLRAFIDKEDDNCNGDDFLGRWEEVLDITIPIYVTGGAASADEESTLSFSGSSGFTLTQEADFSINPEIKVGATIRGASLKDAEIRVIAPMDFNNVLTLSATGSGSLLAEKYLLNPRTFIKVFVAGGIPVVVVGEFSIKVVAQGSVTGSMELQKTLAVNIPAEFGLDYDNSRATKWQVVKSFEPEYRFRVEGEAEANAEISLRLIPDLRISFYDAASARMLAEPYLYAEADLEGHFIYEQNSAGQLNDLDYWFNTLEAGMGVDLRLYAGLDIFGVNLASYPSGASGVDDISNFALFVPMARTPIIGLPTLNVSQTPALNPEDSRAILISGHSQDMANPFGGDSLNPFKHWSGGKVITFQDGSSLTPTPDPQDGQYWFGYSQTGDYTVRLGGYSKLGWFIRQVAETQLHITDSDNDGMADQWEQRFGVSLPNDDPDADGFTNLQEYQRGSYPTLDDNQPDRDGDGMPDAFEIAHGLNPDNPLDAWYDLDGDGVSNLQEYLRGTSPAAGEEVFRSLNDTGITWGADGVGNNITCASDINALQDCNFGRDATHNDDSDGHGGFSFTKLDEVGNSLPASASSWSCVQDNVTGLIWEVKSSRGNDIIGDEGLHDADDRFFWYNTNPTVNGGIEGHANELGATCYGYQTGVSSTWCNSQAFVARVNRKTYCGASDWRMPTQQELRSIVNYATVNPAIESDYFADVRSIVTGFGADPSSISFWSSSVVGIDLDKARYVEFFTGAEYLSAPDNGFPVRLVR